MASSSQDLFTIDNATGRILTTAKPLSDDGELDLSFDEWHQAWQHLLDLIKEFIPQEFLVWEQHYSFILNNKNRAELWPLYLAYDAKIRKRTTQLPIDPSKFSIGFWNDLEARYTAKKVYSLVQSDMKHHPAQNNSFQPNNSQSNPCPGNLNRTRSSSFRPHNHTQSSGRCIFCGDTSRSHLSRNFPTTCNVSGNPCHLLKQGPSGLRQDKLRKFYCFIWNSTSGCNQTGLVAVASTGVQYVVQNPIMPSIATLSHSLLIINTPFIPSEWEKLLKSTTSFNLFQDVPNSMRFGFDMGVNTAPAYTYTPPNHNSALSYPDHVLSHIHNELSLRWYSGPFSLSRLQSLIDNFRTSLGTVPKASSPNNCWIVQDLSFPKNTPSLLSINDQIDINDFRCNWGTFNEVRDIIINAPDNTEAATLDVDSAFRCCPIIPSQQPNFIIH